MEHMYRIEKMDGVCAAFGRFDALHKGHQFIIQALVRESKKKGLPSVLISFVPPSGSFVYTTEEEKESFLKDSGIDVLISCDESEAADFTALVKKIGAVHVVHGINQRSQPIETAAKTLGISTCPCKPFIINGHVLSMAMLDEVFSGCDFQTFRYLCARPYRIIGTIVHGRARGKTVGMPTANLAVEDNKKRPPEGVYATLTEIDGVFFKGLTNIGRRPSVDDDECITVETFLFDFSDDIYGKKIVLEIHAFIRPVMKFGDLAGVKEQVQKDIVKALSVLPKTI